MKEKTKQNIFIYSAFAIAFAVIIFFYLTEKETAVKNNEPVISADGTSVYSNSALLRTDGNENPLVPLEKDDIMIDTLTLASDFSETQFVIYRKAGINTLRVFFTKIIFDAASGGYKRVWTDEITSLEPDTVTISQNDLLGDHSTCIIINALNKKNEHVMLVFRDEEKIADIVVDGTVSVVETERSQGYAAGTVSGAGFAILTRGYAAGGSNASGQLETSYTYSQAVKQYVKANEKKLPVAAIEESVRRDVLSGDRIKFQEFISGLWYCSNGEETTTRENYIYIDPASREIVFYTDDAQEVFSWLHFSNTRYGIYIATQNISVTTLRRFVDIELETANSINVKVSEDVRLKLNINNQWNGSYKKVPSLMGATVSYSPASAAFIDKEYDSRMGVFFFFPSGEYRIDIPNNPQKGRYAFFDLAGNRLLELQPMAETVGRQPRETFLVVEDGSGLLLTKVKLGTRGIFHFEESPVALYAR